MERQRRRVSGRLGGRAQLGAGDGGADIYGQLVGAEGELAGSNFRVSGAAATSASWPAVAANPIDNEYLVVWEDGRNQATRARDIYGQRLATAGSRSAATSASAAPTPRE